MICDPFMLKIIREPLSLLCHRMSALPSSLKSPVEIDHSGPTCPKTWPAWIWLWSISNSIRVPSVRRNRMSLVPSPLKSSVNSTSHSGST